MTLAEQASILLEAIESELLQPADIVRWADGILVAMENPPAWIIDVSTVHPPDLEDVVRQLREHASALPVRRQVQVIVLAHDAGLLSLRDTLPKLFRVTILERGERSLDELDKRLVEALVDWDFQEDLDVIEPSLQVRLAALFREYLTDAQEMAAVLGPKFRKAI
ncbi:MAG: hypothetical protein RLZZ265_2435 [Verrucomicrobiota bacterium]